jgi:hypothetical protein
VGDDVIPVVGQLGSVCAIANGRREAIICDGVNGRQKDAQKMPNWLMRNGCTHIWNLN